MTLPEAMELVGYWNRIAGGGSGSSSGAQQEAPLRQMTETEMRVVAAQFNAGRR